MLKGETSATRAGLAHYREEPSAGLDRRCGGRCSGSEEAEVEVEGVGHLHHPKGLLLYSNPLDKALEPTCSKPQRRKATAMSGQDQPCYHSYFAVCAPAFKATHLACSYT